ncbi:hypothetical protein ACS5PJ_04710 [Pseudarthrobacter sp. YS3]
MRGKSHEGATSVVFYVLFAYVATAKADMAPPLVNQGFTESRAAHPNAW